MTIDEFADILQSTIDTINLVRKQKMGAELDIYQVLREFHRSIKTLFPDNELEIYNKTIADLLCGFDSQYLLLVNRLRTRDPNLIKNSKTTLQGYASLQGWDESVIANIKKKEYRIIQSEKDCAICLCRKCARNTANEIVNASAKGIKYKYCNACDYCNIGQMLIESAEDCSEFLGADDKVDKVAKSEKEPIKKDAKATKSQECKR